MNIYVPSEWNSCRISVCKHFLYFSTSLSASKVVKYLPRHRENKIMKIIWGINIEQELGFAAFTDFEQMNKNYFSLKTRINLIYNFINNSNISCSVCSLFWSVRCTFLLLDVNFKFIFVVCPVALYQKRTSMFCSSLAMCIFRIRCVVARVFKMNPHV